MSIGSNFTFTHGTNSTVDILDLSCMMSRSFRNVQLTVSVILFVLTVFGNSLVLASLLKFRSQFKGSFYMFIGNLAASDLIMGLSMTLYIAEEIWPPLLDIQTFCYAKVFTFLSTLAASIMFMMWISIDRYMAVIFPFRHRVKTGRKKLFVILCTWIWIVAILLSTSSIFIPKDQYQGDASLCRIGSLMPVSYTFYASFVFLSFVLINFGLYGLVVRKIRNSQQPGCSSIYRNNVKTRLMIIVHILFAITYLPFMICSFFIRFDASLRQDVFCVREYIGAVARINTTLNWIVYGLDNQKFRTAFKSLLSCRKCCRESSSGVPTISEAFRNISSEAH